MHGPHRPCSKSKFALTLDGMESLNSACCASDSKLASSWCSAGPSYNGSSSASMQIGGTSSVAVAAPVTMSAGVPSDAGTNRNNHASSFLPSTTIDTKVEECKDLPSSMRWSKAITMFGHDERFNAVERSKEREDLFENYLVELENKEKAKAAEERKRRIPEYREFLESCDSVKWADASTEWKEFTTAEGRKYYYNKIARELAGKTSNQQPVWENESTTVAPVGSTSVSVEPSSLPAKQPSSLVGTIASSAHDAIANLPPPGTGLSYNGDVSSSGSIQNGGTSAAVVAPVQVLVVMEAKRRMPTAGKINVTPLEDETSEEETVVYANNLEAKNAFKSLLESANVQSDWSWDQAMRAITSDKRYGALKTLGERKQAFNGYLNHRKKIEVEERRVKQRKARDDFLAMLEECKDLTSSMRWSKAITMFGHDERFNAVECSKEREDLFENYLVGLQRRRN